MMRVKGPFLQIFQLVGGEEHRKDEEMKPLACKAQPTNGSLIIQIFDDFLDKFVRQIVDGSVSRSLSEREPSVLTLRRSSLFMVVVVCFTNEYDSVR